MFKNGWVNREWTGKHTVGLEALETTVGEYDPQTVQGITGVGVGQLQEAARILGTTRSLLSTALQGVYQSHQATASACQINNINLLRGIIGKPGSGILQMNGQPTAQNNREAGCDGEYPGFRNHQNPAHMADLAHLWNIDPIQVPHWNEPTHVMNLLNHLEQGTIRLFWISGTNPLVSLPNLPRIRRLLTNPELLVVCQDIYMTETAALADVVLPAAQWGEKTGCFTNVDRTVHLSHKAVDPPGEAKSDLDIFLDYARRMGFKDKDGQDLLPWKSPEEVFEAFKRLSARRPCDYTGLSYQRLTGGSGIQWPCNEANPHGTERLFTDGVFFTDVEYCESFGHDLETGAPHSKTEYERLNPAGRAILKGCHYAPPVEEPDADYPLRLATGRNVYHFHTRTKTGRTSLQKACPSPEVKVSEQDAAAAGGIADGDTVVVRSRRGAVEMRCRVGNIAPGQVFIPFHFGYWDSTDGRARAANELTMDRWDPISKQPMFKSGAVRIEKCKSRADNDDKPEVLEQQSAAVERASRKDAASTVSQNDLTQRQRQMELWLGETYETTVQLLQIYGELIPKLIHDQEVEAGVRVLHNIAERMRARLEPHVQRLGENKQRGYHRAHVLREALFPPENSPQSTYEVLETLQGLAVYLAHIASSLAALQPVALAMWDKEFSEAVEYGQQCLHRMRAWTKQQIRVRSPQTLLVPILNPASE